MSMTLEDRLNSIDRGRPAEMEAHVYPGGVEVTHLSVNGPARRRGVATDMLERVIALARGAPEINHVSVVIGGDRASAELLRGLGFNVDLDDDGVVHGRLEVDENSLDLGLF